VFSQKRKGLKRYDVKIVVQRIKKTLKRVFLKAQKQNVVSYGLNFHSVIAGY